MQELIKEKVSVISSYNSQNGLVIPRKIHWRGRDYLIKKLNYHHRLRQGKILLHIFHITDGVMDFRLQLNSDTLHWMLEEISDGSTD